MGLSGFPDSRSMPCSELAPEAPKPRILVVEDDVLIRLLLAELLRAAGAWVIEAATADEAWAVLAAGQGAELIIADVRMPGSMNGAELARRVRSTGPNLPIILTTADFGTADLTGLGIVIRKPFHPRRLLDLVVQLLDLPSPKFPP